MIAQDLLDLLRRKPFVPFRIQATDGRTFDVHHPDQALVLQTRVILPIPSNTEIPQTWEHLSISHIIRFEELATGTTIPKGGNSKNGS